MLRRRGDAPEVAARKRAHGRRRDRGACYRGLRAVGAGGRCGM